MAHITRRLPLSDKVFYVQQAQKAANFYAAKLLQKMKNSPWTCTKNLHPFFYRLSTLSKQRALVLKKNYF